MLRILSHKNIVRVLGYSLLNKFLYIFLEYGDGGSLAHMIKEFGPLPEPLVVMYIEQVLEALQYLHRSDVIHRDLKAANILLSKAEIKLCDFGVSAGLHDSSKQFSVVGSPYWIAPEIVEISGHCPESDVWSLGCTIIELLTGSPPFYNLNPMAAMFKIVNSDMPIPKNCSPEMIDFLEKCFKKNPAERPSAKELANHPLFQKAHPSTNTNTNTNPNPSSNPSTDDPKRLDDNTRSSSLAAFKPTSGLTEEMGTPLPTLSVTTELTEMRRLDDEYSQIQEEISDLKSKNETLTMSIEQTEKQLEEKTKEYRFLLSHTMEVIKAHAIGCHPDLEQKITNFEQATGLSLNPSDYKHSHHHSHHRHRHRHSDTGLISFPHTSPPLTGMPHLHSICETQSSPSILALGNTSTTITATASSSNLPALLLPSSDTSRQSVQTPPVPHRTGTTPPLSMHIASTPEPLRALSQSATFSADHQQKKKKTSIFSHFRRKSDD
ncbi:MAP kinase kinase [Pelomyxa schiedti]|nr:MAP kinase kinase [Pelomyxa schiedti]